MKRSKFFRVMGNSLRETWKEISSPFVEEEWERLQHITDDLIGLKWFELDSIDRFSKEGVYERLISNKYIAIIKKGNQFIAFEKICPRCMNLLQWMDYSKQFKCFLCDQGYRMEEMDSERELKFLPIRLIDNKVTIGIIV